MLWCRPFFAAVFLLSTASLALADSQPPIPRPQSSDPDRRFDVSGEDLGPTAWHAIEPAASRVHFADPAAIKRAKSALVENRYVEFLTLKNGTVVNYAQMDVQNHYLPTAFDMALRSQTQSAFLRARDVEFDASRLKWAGHLQYFTAETDKANCFFFHGAPGATAPRRTTAETYGNVCFPKWKSAQVLEREMLTLLASARFPDEDGNYVRSLEIDAPTQQ